MAGELIIKMLAFVGTSNLTKSFTFLLQLSFPLMKYNLSRICLAGSVTIRCHIKYFYFLKLVFNNLVGWSVRHA
jgi:hypothetical protein